MKKRSVDIYDSDISYNSNNKYKGIKQLPRTDKIFNTNNFKDISKDLKDHFKSSKYEHLNDTVNDILMSMIRKEEMMLDFSRNRDSILHNIEVKNVETQKNSFKKSGKRTSSLHTQESLTKNVSKLVSRRNSCEKSKRNQDLSRSPNKSRIANNKSFYEREMINLEKKKMEIEAIKSQRIADERIINTNRPQLSENSQKIIDEKLKHHKPVYLRSADIIHTKKIEESRLTNKYVTQLTEKNNSYIAATKGKIQIQNKKINLEDSPVTRWLKKMELYKAKQDKKMETIKLCSEQGKKEAESFPFKPIISNSSDFLAQMNYLEMEII